MTERYVIWVDEDERIWAPERSLLEGLGIKVIAISDATAALRLIADVPRDQIALIILDVMLLQGEDLSVFSDSATFRGLRTGLVLGRRLVSEGLCAGEVLLFFSRVMDAHERSEVARTARELKAKYVPKSSKTQGRNFVQWLKENKIL